MSASRYDGRRPEPPYPTPQADAMQRASEVELIGDLLEALQAHDRYMLEAGYSGPEDSALHPKAAENWRRVRDAIAVATTKGE